MASSIPIRTQLLRPVAETSPYDTLVSVVFAGVAVTFPYWFFHLFDWEDGAGLAFIAVPIVAFLNLFAIVAATRQDSWLRRCMVAGFAAKLASASIYMLIAATLWDWNIDVYGYVNEGSKWAHQVSTIGEIPVLTPFYGTNFVTMLTGMFELLLGRSFAALSVIYSVAAFWGQYFSYAAFRTAFPKGNKKLAAVLIFLVPSAVYWTAMVGKDALLCFGTGLATYGFVQVSSRLNLLGLTALVVGTFVDFLTRPHIAALVMVAATIALLLGRNIRGTVGAVTRLLAIPLVLAFTVYIGMRASDEWGVGSVQSGITKQEAALRDNSYGGSAFRQSDSIGFRVALAPTLLFRPFPWEVTSWQAALASLEGMALLVMCWRRRRALFQLAVNMRQNPLIIYSIVFIFMFMFGVAPGISNFGLLVRQRVMVLPFAFVLLPLAEIARPRMRFPRGFATAGRLRV